MKILVTGAAGFIGAAVASRLLIMGHEVIGLDNHNDYYEPALKEARVGLNFVNSNYRHVRADISDKGSLESLFKTHTPQVVVNLAAQAGVRYSIQNPSAYILSNVVGFMNVLEACRVFNVEHLVYASSSSVYGANSSMPYSAGDNVNHPLSVYAASKKANELMAHTYSHLYGLPTTGLRFFTVYGPWGRPDMALFKFTQAILNNAPIDVFNYGNHRRDFTYIDDIVEGVIRIAQRPAQPNEDWDSDCPDPASSSAPWRIYNIGNNRPVLLLDYIQALESALGKKANLNLLPIQPGDLVDTFADVDELVSEFGYRPRISVDEGVGRFVKWYRDHYGV